MSRKSSSETAAAAVAELKENKNLDQVTLLCRRRRRRRRSIKYILEAKISNKYERKEIYISGSTHIFLFSNINYMIYIFFF